MPLFAHGLHYVAHVEWPSPGVLTPVCVWLAARFKVGQNLYSSSSTRLDNFSEWRRAIYAWYDEVALFNPENIEPFV